MIVFFNLYHNGRPPERRKHEVCMSHPLLLRRACNGSVYGIKNDPFTLKNSHNLTVKIINFTEKIRLLSKTLAFLQKIFDFLPQKLGFNFRAKSLIFILHMGHNFQSKFLRFWIWNVQDFGRIVRYFDRHGRYFDWNVGYSDRNILRFRPKLLTFWPTVLRFWPKCSRFWSK